MKFLCDRCKTRYSIGDDRVRGKILKIRCKNCANVITVREGMTAEDASSAGPDRNRATTAAPLGNAAPSNGALASAFANQLTKPPPALEEEWYVSIDGDQSGPFSLSDAQRWIANKAYDADVHCWSEGFDDWLPVDKVSHFRGLRKRPVPPTAPPPLPRAAPGRTGPAVAMHQEDLSEPKPLFAATMASIERAAGIPPSPQTPPNGVVAKANGTGSAPVPRITDNGGAKSPAIPSTIAVNKNGSGSTRPSTVPGLGQSAGAKALATAFDASEGAAPSSATTVDAPAFPSERKPALASVPEPESDGAPDDDGLDIGEVSRVVKLADLMKAGNAPRKKPAAGLRATGSTPKLDPASLGISIGATGPAPALTMPEVPLESPAVAAPVVAQAHRRGLIMLIGVAALLLAGVAALVVVMVQRTDDGGSNGGLAQNHAIDTSRPEDIVFRQLPGEKSGSASQKPLVPIHRPNLPHNPVGGTTEDTGEGKGDKLKSDEIEDMARKQSAGTQRCYMRAQRGAEGIEIADLKKLSVTLTVDKTGVVTDVGLNEHGTDTLGQCLIGQIKRWKFRESPGGLYRIILAFAS